MQSKEKSVSQLDAQEAIKTLLRWIGENPNREGLLDTPKRVVNSFAEFFQGYQLNPHDVLQATFSEVEGYSDMILLKDIALKSYCEHHLAPIIGVAHIAYVPNKRVVGISKLARVVEIFGKRLQLQERLTMQIANAINAALSPVGVAVAVESAHHCIIMRGVNNHSAKMYTQAMLGCFQDLDMQKKFLSHINA